MLQLSAREKRRRSQALSDLLNQIKKLEAKHKQNLSHQTLNELQQCRLDLRQLLLAQHKKSIKRFKANYYAQGNKAGHLLDNYLKARQSKANISSLLDPTTGWIVFHPWKLQMLFNHITPVCIT